MSVAELIQQCRDAGIRLQARGDRLHVEAPAGTISPELRQRLTEYKADLLALHAIRRRLLGIARTLGIPRAVVDALPVEELEATAQQAASCEGYRDGDGDPLAQSLLVFYLKCLADRAATASHLPE
jgi:TubC N-terminal docking domain